jgi:P pilus assembly chaperone PapD
MKYILLFFIFLITVNTNAGGIGLGATRVIYPSDANQKTIAVTNSSLSQDFLISSWVENSKGDKTQDFIVTPPVYVSEKNTENLLKIVKIKDIPNDNKEQLYYLNVKAIPSSKKAENEDTQNVFQFAVLSRIKILVRPKNIDIIPNLEDKLKIKKEKNEYFLYNPTPYYMNMVNTYINDIKSKENLTVPPYSSLPLLNKNISKFRFQLVNDYGGLTKTVDLMK